MNKKILTIIILLAVIIFIFPKPYKIDYVAERQMWGEEGWCIGLVYPKIIGEGSGWDCVGYKKKTSFYLS